MKAEFGELVAAVQVGTRKSASVRATDFPLEGAERTALAELGTLGLIRRAGAVGGTATPLPTAPSETRRVAESAAVPLAEAIETSVPAAVEWAVQAAEQGLVAPPAVVADLLRLVSRNREFVPVLGARGRWLAEINGIALKDAAAPTPEGEFDSLDWNDRLLVVMRSPQDELLLQKAVGDRKKEVREAALEALVKLPNSPQARELRALAERAVALHRSLLRNTMAVEPPAPEALPKWLPRSTAGTGIGERAHALRDLLAYVPPTTWGRAPDDLLALAQKTEYASMLGDGWGDAALRFDDQAWIDTLFQTEHATTRYRGRLAPRATSAAFDRVAIPLLRSKNPQEGQSQLLSRLQPFSPELSRATVEAAKAGGINGYYANDLAIRLDPSVLPLFDAPWGEDGVPENFRVRCRPILDLRRRLRESLR